MLFTHTHTRSVYHMMCTLTRLWKYLIFFTLAEFRIMNLNCINNTRIALRWEKWFCYLFFFSSLIQDSTSGTPVTMRVDANGFYLCWVDQNNEIDLLDIATIRDVRTGQYAKKPRVRLFFYMHAFIFVYI